MRVDECDLTEELVNRLLDEDECIVVTREEDNGGRTYAECNGSKEDSGLCECC